MSILTMQEDQGTEDGVLRRPAEPPEDPPRLFCTFETIPHIPYCLIYFYYSADSGVSSGYLVSGLGTSGERDLERLRR